MRAVMVFVGLNLVILMWPFLMLAAAWRGPRLNTKPDEFQGVEQ